MITIAPHLFLKAVLHNLKSSLFEFYEAIWSYCYFFFFKKKTAIILKVKSTAWWYFLLSVEDTICHLYGNHQWIGGKISLCSCLEKRADNGAQSPRQVLFSSFVLICILSLLSTCKQEHSVPTECHQHHLYPEGYHCDVQLFPTVPFISSRQS